MVVIDKLTSIELADALFASPLQPTESPDPATIRDGILGQLAERGAVESLAVVAQEAGDHPELYVSRMRWAMDMVREVFSLFPGALTPVEVAAKN